MPETPKALNTTFMSDKFKNVTMDDPQETREKIYSFGVLRDYTCNSEKRAIFRMKI